MGRRKTSWHSRVAHAVALILATAGCSASTPDKHPDATQPIFERIQGKWDIVSSPRLCEEGTDIHVIRFNDRKTQAHFERPNPPVDEAGNPIRNYAYTVVSANSDSITLHLIGEKRRLETGDNYIWVIQEREPKVYSWRLHGFPLREPEPATFRRCSE